MSKERRICYYHSADLDGWTSAAIVNEYYEGNVQLVGWTHGDPNPDLLHCKDREIIMVDILIPNFVDIYKESKTFTWIDHHKSSYNDIKSKLMYKEGIDKFNHYYSPDFAACELCWEYYFTDDPVPEAVKLLGLYDSFRHKKVLDEKGQLEVLYFQYYARSICSNPEEAYMFINSALPNTHKEFVKQGKKLGSAIYNYLVKEAQSIYASRFEIYFDGLKFAVSPKERFNPINFGINYHEDGYDGAACYWEDRKSGLRKWSLYSDNGKTDVSEICKKRGGGGHFGAAGFVQSLDNCPLI